MVLTIQGIRYDKTYIQCSKLSRLSSPGNGLSHADEDVMASKVIGIVVILVVSGIVFWFLSNKKK